MFLTSTIFSTEKGVIVLVGFIAKLLYYDYINALQYNTNALFYYIISALLYYYINALQHNPLTRP